MTSKRSYGYIIIAIIMFALCMTGCSSEKDEQPVMHNEVRVLFTYEGFCGVGYNDIILRAVETCSNTYGFEYSFFVPETLEAGMEDYRYSHHKIGITIGVDYLGNFASDFITQTMNKRMDLALSDFFSPWTLGEEISRHRFYTLESGRVTVTQSENHMFDIAEEDWKAYLDSAISKEKEYFKHKDNL